MLFRNCTKELPKGMLPRCCEGLPCWRWLARCARRWPRNRHCQRLTEGVSCWDVLKAMNPLSWKKWKRNSKMIQTYSNSSSASHLSHDCDYGLLYLVYASTIMIHDHDSWSWSIMCILYMQITSNNQICDIWRQGTVPPRLDDVEGVVGVAGLFGVNTTLLGLSPESAKWEGTWENKIKSLKSREWQAQSSARWQWTSQKGSKRMLNVYHFFHCNWCTCMQLCMSELLTCRKWCKGGGDSDTPE